MKKRINIFFPGSLILLLVLASCSKFVEVDPPKNQLSTAKVFADSASATAAIIGIYSNMMLSGNGIAGGKLTISAGLCADELNSSLVSTVNVVDFLTNDIQTANSDVESMWTLYYTYIYEANVILENLPGATGISSQVKNQLGGEARFIRSWCYYYLTALWGDVPLVLTTDYRINTLMPRSSSDAVTAQIIKDLMEAKALLTTSDIGSEKTRPNKWAATALLARTYLYRKEWANAEIQSQEIIASGTYSPLPTPANAFLKTSKETIWQLASFSPIFGTDGSNLIPATTTQVPNYSITDTLFNAFETGDQRKTSWLGSNLVGTKRYYYAYKYKVRTPVAPIAEYMIMLRMAEMYLIHAEACANQNKIDPAKTDVNLIRSRAGLAAITGTQTTSAMLALIEQERRVELFAECGHRWLDLVRTPGRVTAGTSRADDLLSVYKGNRWQPTDVRWPVPEKQRMVNPNLTQNNGY